MLTLMLLRTAFAQSNLPPCQGTNTDRWNNCFGKSRLGEWYQGEWKNGTREGQGTSKGVAGQYVGQWKDNMRNGQGSFTSERGKRYVGEFKDDAFTGQGTVTHENGAKHVGEFKDGVLDGKGIYYDEYGRNIKSGIYKDGQLVTSQYVSPSSFTRTIGNSSAPSLTETQRLKNELEQERQRLAEEKRRLDLQKAQIGRTQGLFKGFSPDENGKNLDAPIQRPKVSPGTIIKDCPDCPEMVVLPGGRFMMGSAIDPEPDPFSNVKPIPPTDNDERPQHSVQIQTFAIGKYELTQEQWYAVMGNNPSSNRGRKLPVEGISWTEVQEFILKLNQKTGQKYRLPSEAEWEYAARAGTTALWSFGSDESKLGDYAWYTHTSLGKTHPVGEKLPNPFGLFDMYGNVSEFTQDCRYNTYIGAPRDGSAWAENNYCNKVIRGGAWHNGLWDVRSAKRSGTDENGHYNDVGFRLARDVGGPGFLPDENGTNLDDPQASKPLDTVTQYFVQFGAFRTLEDAESHRAKLLLSGIKTKISEREISGRAVYRVRVGPFERPEEGERARLKLGEAGIEGALIRVQN